MIAPKIFLTHLIKNKQFLISILLLFVMLAKIIPNEIKECTIKDYDLLKIGKLLGRRTVIKYDEKKRVIEERYYQGFFTAFPLHTILKYEYPDEKTEIEYTYSKHWTSRKNVSIFDNKGNIIRMISYYITDNPSKKKWGKNYANLNYTKSIEHEFEYNDKNDLVLGISIQGLFVDMPGPLENLPNDGLNGKYEEFKYEYNEKGLKIKVSGKNNRKNEYRKEWRYYYDKQNNVIKKEEYILDELFLYTEYKHNSKNLLISEIKINNRWNSVSNYYSFEYYSDGKLKRKNYHNHMDFNKIENMKIFEYEEYTYK